MSTDRLGSFFEPAPIRVLKMAVFVKIFTQDLEVRVSPMNPDDDITAAELGALLKLSVRRVQELAQAGVLPREGRGRYPAGAAVQAYLRYLEHPARRRPTRSGDQKRLEVALLNERHRRLRLQNDEAERRLLRADKVEQVILAAVSLLANRLDGVAGRVASGDAVRRQHLLAAHREIRSAYAADLAAMVEWLGANDSTEDP